MTTPPWFKMHREERGSFAQLPLMARALFGEVLKLTDDHGRIGLGGKAPADAVAFALGADRSDRRALRKYLPMLLEDGCLALEGDDLVAPGWDRFQASEKPRRSRDRATTKPRPCHDGATTVPRTNHDRATTSESSTRNHSGSIDREEKSRVEKSRGGGESTPSDHHSQGRDRWEPPTHYSAVWRVFEAACTDAGLPWPGMAGGRRDADCKKLLERLGPEILVADMRAFAGAISRSGKKPSNPWLRYTDHAGNWSKRVSRPGGVAPAAPIDAFNDDDPDEIDWGETKEVAHV